MRSCQICPAAAATTALEHSLKRFPAACEAAAGDLEQQWGKKAQSDYQSIRIGAVKRAVGTRPQHPVEDRGPIITI